MTRDENLKFTIVEQDKKNLAELWKWLLGCIKWERIQSLILNQMKTIINFNLKRQLSILSLTLIFSLLSMSFSESISQTPRYTYAEAGIIKGKVIDADTKGAIIDAIVILKHKGSRILTTTTSPNGCFSFDALPANVYTIIVKQRNYIETEKSNIVVEPEKTTEVLLKMKLNKTIIDRDPIEVEEETAYESKKDKSIFRSIFPSKTYAGNARGSSMQQAYGADPGAYIDYNTESYDLINENIFKEVIHNPLSTFSIDVDRASYSNVRRFLQNNTMPYQDAIRIEEMINYFDYDYPQPENSDPFSVNMEIDECPWNKDHQLLMIGLQGKDISREDIPAGNLVFLIDVSGSMGTPNKLPLLIQSFKLLTKNLRDDDRVAIVVYAGAAGCVLKSTPGSEKAKIIAALDLLESGGSTAGGEGIKLAYKIAKENFIPGGNNRVILATDGDFNIGASSNAEMTRLIEKKRDEGVFLSVLGFGMGNYKDSKMEQISNAGNGNYAYIDNIMEAKKVFGEELWGTLYTIAKDVKIQVEFNPGKVKAYRLIGYENRILNKEDFNNDEKDAGDIGCGHTVTALYEIIPAGSEEDVSNVDPLEYTENKAAKSNKLLTLKLRYKNPDEDESNIILKKVTIKDIQKIMPSENFRFAASVAEFGMLLRDSEFKSGSTYMHAITLAKNSIGEDEYGYRNEFVKMVEAAELLSN